MDASRKNHPRIAINAIADLQRMKANFQSSILGRLEEQLRFHGEEDERGALLAHLSQVFGTFLPPFYLTLP